MEDIESGPPARRLIGISKMLTWIVMLGSTRDREDPKETGCNRGRFDSTRAEVERRRKM